MSNEYKKKYPLANATRRICARLFDMLLMTLISIGVVCGLTLWTVLNKKDNYNHQLFIGMLLLSLLIDFVIMFIYFIVLPYYWKGYTLFKKIFKIKTHELINHKNLFFHLIKKEFFLWMIFYLITFIFTMLLFTQKDPLKTINELILFQFSTTQNNGVMLPIFQFIYILTTIPIMVIIIHMIINNKKRAIHDYFSDTCVIYLKSIVESKKSGDDNQTLLNKNLPGIVDDAALNEVGDE